MEPFLYAFLGALLVIGVSFIGKIATFRFAHSAVHKTLHYLPSFSAGVFVVIIVGLIEESLSTLTYPLFFGGLGLGFFLLATISFFSPETTDTHDDSCTHTKNPGRVRRLLFADSIHNIGDGIILVPAFAAGIPLGLTVLVGILIHEAVQELSEFFVYKEAGLSTKEALVKNAVSASSILIGVFISTAFMSYSYFEAILLSVAAGAFAFVVVRDLFPHSIKRGRTDFLIHLSAGICGVVLMIGTSYIASFIETSAPNMSGPALQIALH